VSRARRHPTVYRNGQRDPVVPADETEVADLFVFGVTVVQKAQSLVDGESITLLKKAGMGTAQAVEVVEGNEAASKVKVDKGFANITSEMRAAGGLRD